MNFDNLVEDAEKNDAFELAVIELLGPAALTGGKLNAYEIAKMFWNAALSSPQPTPAQIAEIQISILEKAAQFFADGSDSRENYYAEVEISRMIAMLVKGEPL